PVAGPARWAASAALADFAWRDATRHRLLADSARLAGLLSETLAEPRADSRFEKHADSPANAQTANLNVAPDLATGAAAPVENPLFVWLPTPDAAVLAERLAQRGVLVRHFANADCCGLRFGLPGPSTEWRRLAAALKDLK
ncbi:MAG TPA: hypothetical protein VFH22_00150, partial [Rhodocyclaceae bacterium]|nr:hypothetical protein [Rhodocyclaceae bacterium]